MLHEKEMTNYANALVRAFVLEVGTGLVERTGKTSRSREYPELEAIISLLLSHCR